MTLTYSIEKKTKIDPTILVEKTLFYLKENEYDIISNQNNVIIFEYNGGKGFALRGQVGDKLIKGKFEIYNLDNEIIIKLTYTISLTAQLIVALVLIVLGYFKGPFIFLGVCLLLMTLISVFITKSKSEDLLNEIVNKN